MSTATEIPDTLLPYVSVAKLIAGQFPDAEVALHDLTQPESSVVFVSGANATGRAVGQSFDHLVSEGLVNPRFEEDLLAGYFFTSADGRKIRSSTLLLRDDTGEAIGMICVNVDVSATEKIAHSLMSLLYPPQSSQANTATVRPAPRNDTQPPQDKRNTSADSTSANSQHVPASEASHVETLLASLIDSIVRLETEYPIPRTRAVELVQFMDAKGIFLVKGSVAKVAHALGVSNVTVYSYLDQARGKGKRKKKKP